MVKYVLGFMLCQETMEVAFIDKSKPEWQAGLMNGIGGKIEEGETALEAMVREFREETSVETDEDTWSHFLTMSGDGFIIYTYSGLADKETFDKIITTESEPIVKCQYIYMLQNTQKFISNIPWILNMIADKDAVNHPLHVKYGDAEVFFT